MRWTSPWSWPRRRVCASCARAAKCSRAYRTLAGTVTERVLKLHYFDYAVIGVSGFAVRQGFTVNSQVEAATVNLIADHAAATAIVAIRPHQVWQRRLRLHPDGRHAPVPSDRRSVAGEIRRLF